MDNFFFFIPIFGLKRRILEKKNVFLLSALGGFTLATPLVVRPLRKKNFFLCVSSLTKGSFVIIRGNNHLFNWKKVPCYGNVRNWFDGKTVKISWESCGKKVPSKRRICGKFVTRHFFQLMWSLYIHLYTYPFIPCFFLSQILSFL